MVQEEEKKWEEEKKRSRSLAKLNYGAESRRTEPPAASTVKKVAKPKLVAPALTSGCSRTPCKGPGSAHAEPQWKSNRETMEHLVVLHSELFSCSKTRELKERLILLAKGFNAHEWVRKTAWERGREVSRKQTGYS